MTAVALPVLLDCEPYGARLTADACAERWRKAQSDWHAYARSSCRRCPVGKERAGGKAKVTEYDGQAYRKAVHRVSVLNVRGAARDACLEKEQRMRAERTIAQREFTPARRAALAKARAKRTAQNRLPLVIGEQHGLWTVIADAGVKDGKSLARVRCRCGVERDRALSYLRTGRTKGCPGCIRRDREGRFSDAAE